MKLYANDIYEQKKNIYIKILLFVKIFESSNLNENLLKLSTHYLFILLNGYFILVIFIFIFSKPKLTIHKKRVYLVFAMKYVKN